MIDTLQQIHIGLPLYTLYGLVFGSFATMAIHRLPRNEDIIFTPSHCPKCDTHLTIIDLFPIISWLANLGKCRHCKTPISVTYLITEIIMGILFAFVYIQIGANLLSIPILGLCLTVVLSIAIYLKQQNIPTSVIVFTLICAIFYRYILGFETLHHIYNITLPLAIIIVGYCINFFQKNNPLPHLTIIQLSVISGLFVQITGVTIFVIALIVLTAIFTLINAKILHRKEISLVPALVTTLLLCVLF